MRLFDLDELNSRILRFSKYLQTFGFESAVLTSNPDIFYFT